MKPIPTIPLMLMALVLAHGATSALAQDPEPPAALTYEEQADAFFALVAEGEYTKAIDQLYQRNPWNTAIQDQISSLKVQFTALPDLVGEFHGRDLLVEEMLAGRFVYRRYLVSYDRQPVSFHFTFYRPDDEWFIYSFEYKDDVAALAKELAAEKLLTGVE